MPTILIVNPELGWDSVVAILDSDDMTGEQFDRAEKICEENNYILIDWKSIQSVESFLADNE